MLAIAWIVSYTFAQACPTALIAVEQSCNNYLFYLEGTPVGNVIWNFSDGSETAGGIEIFHEFPSDGIYVVSATFSGPECPEMLMLSTTVEITCGAINACPTEIWAFETADCGVMEFELDLFAPDASVTWFAGDESEPFVGGQNFSHFYGFPGLYPVCAFYTSPSCPDSIELCTNVVITDCTTECNDVLLGIDSYMQDGGTSELVYNIYDAASGMIVASGEALYTLVDPFFDANLCLPDGCYFVSFDSNQPIAPGQNLDIFLTMNGMNLLETAEIINQDEINITYFFGVNSDCATQPECYASFETVYTNTPGQVEFINTSTFSGAVEFTWDYGNETTGNTPEGNVQYEANGLYTVCLTVTAGNCQNTYCDYVFIENIETSCIYNEIDVIVDADYFEPVNELLEFGVYVGLNPVYQLYVETDGIMNDTLSLCVPDGCYQVSINSALPVQALSIVCSFEGNNIQQLGDLQLTIGETSSVAAIGVNMDCSISVEEEQLQTINAFPNPASDNIQFSSTNSIETIEIFDLTGKRVFTENPNQMSAKVLTGNWSTGLYIAHIICDSKREQVLFEVVK
jgi:PKD repeat protein